MSETDHQLDDGDPLASFVDRFVRDPAVTYAAGNSLGPLSYDVRDALAAAVDTWGRELVGGWDHWLDVATDVGDRLGAALIGAGAGQVVVGDSTTVNLYKLAAAALDARPDRRSIVVAADEFPTDRYVLEGLAAARGLRIRREIDDTTAVVCRSLVNFRTGKLADIDALTGAAHAAGALMLWDLSHAVGALPVALDDTGVDLAVGCTYKYVNAGPGAPAFAYVRRDLQTELRQPIWGWFGQRDQFVMGPDYDPQPDIRRFHTGTPPILSLAAVDAAVALIAEAGIDAVRAKSSALTERFIHAIGDGFDVVTPRDPDRRGGHVSVRRPDADKISAAMADAGVITDVRGDLVRFGFSPLATRYADVEAAAAALVHAAA